MFNALLISTGAIVGIVVAVVAVILVIASSAGGSVWATP